MDPLSQTIALLRPRGLLWKQLEARGPWAARFPSHTGAAFCLIEGGRCTFGYPGRDQRELSDGDFVFLAAPPVWSLQTGADVAPVDFTRPNTPTDFHAHQVRTNDAGPLLRLLGGHFRFDDTNIALGRRVLPDIVAINAADPAAARLQGVLDAIAYEARSQRPGRALALDRLLELLLVEVIRNDGSWTSEMRPGLLAGLADPRLALALNAVHAEVKRSWTVAQLADIAGMSRSVFADRFARIVGLAPIDYLTEWRMAIAKDMLRAGEARLAEVAFECGYQSTSAFSTAFARSVGCPPSRFADLQRSGVAASPLTPRSGIEAGQPD